MYGAYYGTVPSIHKYIDTSQPLNGFGAAGDMLTIYEGVGALPSAPAKRGGCGCSGPKLGRLAGFGRFGDEVLPDSPPGGDSVGVTLGTNIQTALVALLVAGSAIAVGFAVAGSGKGTAMRANGRRGRRASRRGMRRNGRGGQKYVVLWKHAAGTTKPGYATIKSVQKLCAAKGLRATIATQLGDGRLMHVGTVDASGAFHGAQAV